VSGVWVRCPNCDLEIKVELTYCVDGPHVTIEPEYHLLEDHARNCAEENR
jgi:hypothetical protein